MLIATTVVSSKLSLDTVRSGSSDAWRAKGWLCIPSRKLQYFLLTRHFSSIGLERAFWLAIHMIHGVSSSFPNVSGASTHLQTAEIQQKISIEFKIKN